MNTLQALIAEFKENFDSAYYNEGPAWVDDIEITFQEVADNWGIIVERPGCEQATTRRELMEALSKEGTK